MSGGVNEKRKKEIVYKTYFCSISYTREKQTAYVSICKLMRQKCLFSLLLLSLWQFSTALANRQFLSFLIIILFFFRVVWQFVGIFLSSSLQVFYGNITMCLICSSLQIFVFSYEVFVCLFGKISQIKTKQFVCMVLKSVHLLV